MPNSLENMQYWRRFRNTPCGSGDPGCRLQRWLQHPFPAWAASPVGVQGFIYFIFLPGKVTVCEFERKLVKSWKQGQPRTKLSSASPTRVPSRALWGSEMPPHKPLGNVPAMSSWTENLFSFWRRWYLRASFVNVRCCPLKPWDGEEHAPFQL